MNQSRRISSPNKSPKKAGRPSTAVHNNSTSLDYEQIIADQQHDTQVQISNYEIEVERLKTTVIALNAKTVVVDDHITDVQTTTDRFNDSEFKR